MASPIQRDVFSPPSMPIGRAWAVFLGMTLLALGLVSCGPDDARPFGSGGPLEPGKGEPTTSQPDGGLVRGGQSQAGGNTLSISTPGGTGGAPGASGGASVPSASGGSTGSGGVGATAGAPGTGGRAAGNGGAASGGRVGTGGAPSSTGGSKASTGGNVGIAGSVGNVGSGGAVSVSTSGGATGTSATSAECRQYIIDYDSALQTARACKSVGGMSCGTAVTAKLAGCGSNCVTYVDDTGELDKIRKAWTKAACVDPACAKPVLCATPSGGICNVVTSLCTDLP